MSLYYRFDTLGRDFDKLIKLYVCTESDYAQYVIYISISYRYIRRG